MAKVVIKVGDNISTDIIYPGRYMATVLPEETSAYAFADFPEFNSKLNRKEIPPGSVVVAGDNFGCGSSREQAASCLKGYGLVIIARSVGRIFLQNAINLGLCVIISPTIDAVEGDQLEITSRQIYNRTQEKLFSIVPLPEAAQEIIESGGLIAYTRDKLVKKP